MIATSRQRSVVEGLRERRSSAVGFVAAMLMAAMLVACGDKAPTDPLLDAPLAIHTGEWNGDDARIEGRLEFLGDCLSISPPAGAPYAGGHTYLIFARDGLQWDAKTQVLRIGNREFAVGTKVAFGGSYKNRPGQLDGFNWFKPPAAECDMSRVWYVGRDQD